MEEENIIETEVKEIHESENTEEHKNKHSLALKLLLSAAVGFGGGVGGTLLTLALSQNSLKTHSDVLYQSVIQTQDNGEQVEQLSTQDIVKNVKNSVVEIATSTKQTTIFMEQYVSSGAGSGVILSKEGLIVTNHHVIDGADEIKVTLANGETHEAELIASDAQTDLAVIRIQADNLQPVVLGESTSLNVGENVVAIGNPLGSLGGTVTEGIISALDREITIDGQTMTLLQTSAAINPGNSGGGLFNAKGELIGIVNAKSTGSEIEGLGFAIPVDEMKHVAEDLVKNGKVSGRLSLGVRYYEISSVQSAMQHGVNTFGLLIGEVEPNSNAAKAGIKVDDVLIEADGEQVITSDALKKALNSHKVGDTMTFKVLRGDQTVDLSVVLE